MTEIQKKQIDVCRENGLTIPAIADVTGLSVSALKSYCSRRNDPDQSSEHCQYCGAALAQQEGHRRKHFCNQSCIFVGGICRATFGALCTKRNAYTAERTLPPHQKRNRSIARMPASNSREEVSAVDKNLFCIEACQCV